MARWLSLSRKMGIRVARLKFRLILDFKFLEPLFGQEWASILGTGMEVIWKVRGYTNILMERFSRVTGYKKLKNIGQWKNSQLNGEGERKTPKGEVYNGNWLDGKLNGEGTMIGENGKYTGTYKDNQENGKGKMVSDDLN
jgi:hypothetical protein